MELVSKFGKYFVSYSTAMFVGFGYVVLLKAAPLLGLVVLAINVGFAYFSASRYVIDNDNER